MLLQKLVIIFYMIIGNTEINLDLTVKVIEGLARSKILRAVVITGVVFGAVFLFASNPVGWLASAFGVSLLASKILLGVSAPLLCGALLALQIPLPGTVEFELSALARLMRANNQNRIDVPGWKKDDSHGCLFLGALPNRLRYDSSEIDAVLSVNEEWETKPYGLSIPFDKKAWDSRGIAYNSIVCKDHTLLTPKEMERGADWINEQLKSGNSVLVHCRAGVGRSATVVAAYLMKYARDDKGKRFSLETICRAIKRSRPNATIWDKLVALDEYEKYEDGAFRPESSEQYQNMLTALRNGCKKSLPSDVARIMEESV